MKGSCLCGAVRIRLSARPTHPPEACHCSLCRKHSGHVLAAVNVHRDTLTVEGEDLVGWYASSEKVDRGFCTRCGSTLFWRPNLPDYPYTAVSMGLFDEPTGMRLAKHTFVAEKGDYYDIADGVPQREGF